MEVRMMAIAYLILGIAVLAASVTIYRDERAVRSLVAARSSARGASRRS
jgi:hypothetical protein